MDSGYGLPPTFGEVDLGYFEKFVCNDSTWESTAYSSSLCYQPNGNTVINVIHPYWGESGSLGRRLLLQFFTALVRQKNRPRFIILSGSGVVLLKNNAFVNVFAELEGLNVSVLLCPVSLDAYSLSDSVSVGFEASFDEISSIIMNADKVITI